MPDNSDDISRSLADQYKADNPNSVPTNSDDVSKYFHQQYDPTSFVNSQDQVQSSGNNYIEAGKSALIGGAKAAANAADFVATPFYQDLTPGNDNSFSKIADKYLPEATNKPVANIAEGAGTGAAMAGFPGAVIGGASAAGTEVLNKIRPKEPIANVVEPALLSALFTPGAVNQILKLGRVSAEGLGILSRPSLMQAKIDQGITAGTPASTTDSDFWYKMQRTMREALFGGKSINKSQETEQSQLNTAINRRADTLGPEITKQEMGVQSKQGISDGVTLVKGIFNQVHNALDQAVPPNTTHVDMYPYLTRMIDDMSPRVGAENQMTALGLNPEKAHINPLIEDITRAVQAGGPNDSLSISNLRTVRQGVGDKLQESLLNGDASKRQLKIVYGTLADAEASAYTGTPYEAAYNQLKAAEHEMYSSIENFAEPLVREGLTPEVIANRMTSEMKLGGSKLEHALTLINEASPAIRDQYSSMVLRSLGKDVRGEFDSNRFFTNWQKISPEAKQQLFSGGNNDLPRVYDQLALIAENQARGAKAVNPSRTAGTAEIFSLLSRFGAAIGGIGGYELGNHASNNNDDSIKAGGGALAGALAMSTIGYATMGRLMTNPMFIRWLGTPVAIQDVPAHMRLLTAIGGEVPELKANIGAFQNYANSVGVGHKTQLQPGEKGRGFATGGLAELPEDTDGYALGGLTSTRRGTQNLGHPNKFKGKHLEGFAEGGPSYAEGNIIPNQSPAIIDLLTREYEAAPDKHERERGFISMMGNRSNNDSTVWPHAQSFEDAINDVPNSYAEGGKVFSANDNVDPSLKYDWSKYKIQPVGMLNNPPKPSIIDTVMKTIPMSSANDFAEGGSVSRPTYVPSQFSANDLGHGIPAADSGFVQRSRLPTENAQIPKGGKPALIDMILDQKGVNDNARFQTGLNYSGGGVTDRIISNESGNNPNAKNPRSSASGSGQFLDSTWVTMMREYHPEIADPLSVKNNPEYQREMTDRYKDKNSSYLQSKGLPVTPGTIYLSHFLGPAGAAKVLTADPSTPVASLFDTKVTKANPNLKNMSSGDLVNMINRKMGDTTMMASNTKGQPSSNASVSSMDQPQEEDDSEGSSIIDQVMAENESEGEDMNADLKDTIQHAAWIRPETKIASQAILES